MGFWKYSWSTRWSLTDPTSTSVSQTAVPVRWMSGVKSPMSPTMVPHGPKG